MTFVGVDADDARWRRAHERIAIGARAMACVVSTVFLRTFDCGGGSHVTRKCGALAIVASERVPTWRGISALLLFVGIVIVRARARYRNTRFFGERDLLLY